MSLLSNSVSLLNAGLRAAGGEEGTYRRGNKAIEQVVAVPAKAATDSYGAEGVGSSLDRDWIFWAADLTKAGQRWTPQRDDCWDCKGKTYIVLPRENDLCFRPTDPSEQQLRVYMMETAPVNV